LWYTFVATDDDARLQTCDSVAQDSTFALYEGSCGSLIQVGCSEDDGCGISGWLGDQTVTGLTSGTIYYIQISARDASARGKYTLQLQCGSCDLFPSAPSLEKQYTKKSRYISFIPGNNGVQTAVRVTMDSVEGFSSFNGQARWVGPPDQYQESALAEPKFWGASLQCEPFYFDWGPIDVLHVYGDAVVPNSLYTVQVIELGCAIYEENQYSGGVSVPTGKWGDVIEPFSGTGSIEPSINDVLAVVKKWKGHLLPIKASAQLQLDILDPSKGVNIKDVLLAVDGWKGKPYPYDGPSSCQ